MGIWNRGDPGGPTYGGDRAARAAFRRGARLAKRGEITAAQSAYRQAAGSSDLEYGPQARLALGNLLRDSGDLGGARAAYQSAIDTGHPEAAPAAAIALGTILTDISDDPQATEGALVAFRYAADAQHPYYAAYGALMLALLLGFLNDFPGARAAARRSVAARPPEEAAKGLFESACFLAEQFGDFEGASEFLREIIDSADPYYAATARAQLDLIDATGRDLEAYRRAVDAAVHDSAEV